MLNEPSFPPSPPCLNVRPWSAPLWTWILSKSVKCSHCEHVRRGHAPQRQVAFPRVGADKRAQCERPVERRAAREEDWSQPDNLLSPARYVAGRRLRDVRRDERPFRSHAASAHVERRRVLSRPIEPGGASGDVQPARPGILAERLRGLRTRL